MPSINDNFADAIEVVIETAGGTYTSASLDTNENTTEVGEPEQGASANVSAWWFYIPISSGTADFDTILSTPTGSGTDTYMAIWTGTNFGDMVLVASDDDSGGSGTSLINDLAVTADEPYWIQVGGFGLMTMNVVLRVTGPETVSSPDGTVDAVPATATAEVLPPGVSGGSVGGGSVSAVTATATAEALPPSSVSGETVVSGGGPATATAEALPPNVSGGAAGDGQITAIPATASAEALAPTVSDGVIPDMTIGTGESRQDNAMRRLRTEGYSGSLQDMQRAWLLDEYGGAANLSVADLQIQSAALDQVYDILPDDILPVDA